MAIFSFGDYIEDKKFKVLDERMMRASSGLMLLLGLVAFANGFLLNNFEILPYFTGFILVNFAIGLFINPRLSPTGLVAGLIVHKQSPQYIGAVQKKFAYSLGLSMSVAIFILAVLLQDDFAYFEPLCILCVICLALMYTETAFGICVGCKLYDLALYLRIIPKPAERPNCMGDSCSVE